MIRLVKYTMFSRPHRFLHRFYSQVTTVLLCVYVLYAVSPLAYDTISNQPGACCAQCGGQTKTIKLFIIEAFLSAVMGESKNDHGSAQDHSCPDSDHILLKKKRALRTSVVNLIAILSTHTTKRLGIPDPQTGPVVAVQFEGIALQCPNGYQFLHSGTSPPSA